MGGVDWKQNINFASALLLHSCITVLLKESLNLFVILYRLSSLAWAKHVRRQSVAAANNVSCTVVLDAYTSVFSKDPDGELAELYFTNTGVLLLAVSLLSSIAMNVYWPNTVLNVLVGATFALCFVASLTMGKVSPRILAIVHLRRASRFIWSDSPFVNFFSLIYIATVLHGQSTLRLQDYLAFRAVAIVEFIFMKAHLASRDPKDQEKLARMLIESEWKPWGSSVSESLKLTKPPFVKREEIVAFQTLQRLSVMLGKTSIGYVNGCLLGPRGPCRCLLPTKGRWVKQPDSCLQVYRISKETIILVDRFDQENPRRCWERCLRLFHGILLRIIGRVRVVYAILDCEENDDKVDESSESMRFHSNINLVTGVSKAWLAEFTEEDGPVTECIVAFRKQ